MQIKWFILALILCLNVSYAFNRKQLSTTMLNVFSGQCKSIGKYSQSALNQSKALINMLEALIEDEQCGEATELVSSIYAFNQLMEANSISDEQHEVMILEKSIEEITLALNDETDPIVQSQLATQLSISRIQLITANAALGVAKPYNTSNRENVGYYYAQDSLKQILNGIPKLQNCSKKFRQQATQIVGAALSTASFFVNPALGAVMAGASAVVTTGVNAIYTASSNFQLRKLDDINLPTALSCSAEALTNMYCETLRAEDVVKKYASLEEDKNSSWNGMPFIFRKLPPLIDWLELVRAGSAASDAFDAERRLEVMGHDSFLNELKQRLDGFISDTDREIKTLSIDLNNYLLSKIEYMVSQLQQSKPIETLNSREFLPFRLLGFKDIPKCNFQGQLNPCPNLATFRVMYNNGGSQGYRFSLNDWNNAKENMDLIYKEARDFVNQQLSRILNEDRESVVARAFEGYQGKWSSYEILFDLNKYAQEVKEYLIKTNVNNQYNAQILNIENTQVMVMRVYDLLTNWRNRKDLPKNATVEQLNDAAGKLLAEIFQTFNLRTGQRFLMERIKSIVRWDIIARMKNNDFDAQLSELIRLNNTNIINDITSYNLFNLQDVINDIDNSKGILRSTMHTFFGKMHRYYKQALDLIEDRGLEEGVKNKLCIHLLASDEIQDGVKAKKIRKACSGVVLKSIFNKKHLEVKFDDHIDAEGNFKTSFNTRACLFNNFMRKVKIREQFKDQ